MNNIKSFDIQFNSPIKINIYWTDFSKICKDKNLEIQYIESVDSYIIFAVDGNITYICNIIFKSVSSTYAYDVNYSNIQNDLDYDDFVNNYMSVSNKSLAKLDDYYRQIVIPELRCGNETIYTTHNFCDPVSWFSTSERVNNKILESIDGYIWKSNDSNWIDMISGRVQDDDGLVEHQKELNADDPHGYEVIITVDGVVKTMRLPFFTSGGDYSVYWNDGYIISFEDWSNKNVTASYSKAIDSTFILKPIDGFCLDIEAAEADFTEDVEMTDAIEYIVYGYASVFAPQLNLPEGTKIPIQKNVYKRFSQILNESIGSYPIVNILSTNNDHINLSYADHKMVSRGLKSRMQSIPFRYGTVRKLHSMYGMELHVKLSNDNPFIGDFASCTFYCTSKEDK